MRHDSFAALILTHGRPDNVITERTLRRQGYTGRIVFVLDDEDKTADLYRKNFGSDAVRVFCKQRYFDEFDTFDNDGSRSVIFAARNAAFDIASDLGLTYFLELDDDYTSFQYRHLKDRKLGVIEFTDLDAVFDAYLDFLDTSKAKSVAFAQGGDFIGGAQCPNIYKGLLRKAMNSFFCRTDNRFAFSGRINEDVNTYTMLSNRGDLFFSTARSMLTQKQTQSQSGGMTEAYLDSGTYLKTFYSVICSPQAVKIATMGDTHKRIHHHINWNACAPKILNEKYRKV